jgi:hypothetical protein
MRTRWLLVSIWICFLFRGWFYASMFPTWEGYDEFAHFGVIRAIAAQGLILVPRDYPGPRDVEESLRLAPVPWEVRNWPVFRNSLTQEQYWSLPAQERDLRQDRLRHLPPGWARENSAAGVSAYEALQPPLYYWLMAPVVSLLKGSGLLAQVMVLRWICILIASFAVPLTFAIALEGFRSEPLALSCAALVAVMPGFAGNAARISNEPLSILLFSLLAWIGLRIIGRAADIRNAVALGAVLGLGLLTKAYFLTALPAVFLLVVYKYRKARMPALAMSVVAAALAGWWYVRNLVTTGTLAGLAESVTLHNRSAGSLLAAVPTVPWLRAVDVILVSHLYFCGWSSLTVRSWMYHLFFAFAALAAIGLVLRARGPAVLWLAAIYGFFWLGQLYNVLLQYLTKGLAGSMGWYMYAVVGCEVVLCAGAFGRFRLRAAAIAAVLFGLLDLYATQLVAIPYYTGLIGHRANGSLMAFHAGTLRAVGFTTVFERLAANKPALFSGYSLIALWTLYVAGTLMLIGVAVALAASRNAGLSHAHGAPSAPRQVSGS